MTWNIQREGEAKLAGKKFKPAIEPPYRWRDWAAKPDGITGDELLAFINQEEATLAQRQEGRGPVPLICARSPVPTATIGAMSSPPCFAASRTA